MNELYEFLDIVINVPDEACGGIVNFKYSGCPNGDIDCDVCIFDSRGKPVVSKANKILITLKE